MKQRNPAMDVVRCFALFCVISIHFFMNTEFYDVTVSGFPMFCLVSARCFFMICVPLFLVLSGYLLSSKKLSKAYYGKILQTVGIYLLASLFCAAYTFFFDRENFSFAGSILGLFSFTTAQYSWYVEMYIGLFLLIPFLNVMYNGMPGQKQKKLLVLTFLILTTLPTIINIWQPFNLRWWKTPSISDKYNAFIPDWWQGIYPLTFYFIGCYLREFPLKLKRSYQLLLIVLVFLVNGIFNYYRMHGVVFKSESWNTYRSVPVTLLTVLVFSYLSSGDYSSMSNRFRKVLAKVSEWSLGAYLCSWVFDTAFYPILLQAEPTTVKRILYFPIIVPCVYVCSVLASAILNLLYKQLEKLFTACSKKKSST